MTPDHYFIDKQKNIKTDQIINNFIGGLTFWRANTLKYCIRAFNKHDNPIKCLNKALHSVILEEKSLKEDREYQKSIDWNGNDAKDYTPIIINQLHEYSNFKYSLTTESRHLVLKDQSLHKKALDPNSYNKVECNAYRKFLVDIYKWCLGWISSEDIQQKIAEQVAKHNTVNI